MLIGKAHIYRVNIGLESRKTVKIFKVNPCILGTSKPIPYHQHLWGFFPSLLQNIKALRQFFLYKVELAFHPPPSPH